MTRLQAIEELWEGCRRDAYEYGEQHRLEDVREALRTLGVTEEELKECHD